MKKKKYLWMIIGILILIVLDQIIKAAIFKHFYDANITLINGVLDLSYVENAGSAFGVRI